MKFFSFPTICTFLLGSCFVQSVPFPFHDFISNLSDRVNELKRAVLSAPQQSRSSSFDLQAPLITDRFVSRDPKQIRFLLYDKRLSPYEYTELHDGDTEVFNKISFGKTKPLKILMHGFNHNGTEGPGTFPRDAKNAYLEHTDYNVLVVEWGALAKPKPFPGVTPDVFYPIVVSNVPRVGEELGKLLVFMIEKEFILSADQIHIIGFSLGAHAAGIAGSYVKEKTSKFIGRITGLDPASPMYERAPNSERLDVTDADFVDVIHSSRLGLHDRVGHVDFYVNGGKFQADCYQLSEETPRQTFSDFYRAVMGSCGHSRAPFYYTHSIRAGPGEISGCGCPTWKEYLLYCRNECRGIVNFGEYCPHTARGVFFLEITIDDVKA